MGLVLVSGAGLLGFVVLGLWQAVRDAGLRAELDARADAEATARACRALLRDPRALELTPTETRFSISDGAIVVPTEVAWLQPKPDTEPDIVVQEKLDQAARAELDSPGNGDGAVALYDALLQSGLPQGAERLQVLAAAGWQARRAGDEVRVLELLGALEASAGQDRELAARLAAPCYARAVGSWVLLHAAAHGALTEVHEELVTALPPQGAGGLFARLAEHGVDIEPLMQRHAAAMRGRRLCVAVDELLSSLLGTGAAVARPAQDGVVLYYPDIHARRTPPTAVDLVGTTHVGTPGGALLPTADLADALHAAAARNVPGIVWKGDPVIATPLPAEAFAIVPGALGVLPRPQPSATWSQPWTIGAAGIALALAFGLSLLLVFRAMRTEALAMRSRAEFLTTVTHELKTPLAAIRLLSEMLEEGRVEDARRDEYYGLLSGEASRLTVLIENVLDLGRMERGERAYDLRSCDLAALVDEVVRLFAPVAAREGLQVEQNGVPGPVPGRADRSALTQALLNVLDNARKYAAAGEHLTVTTESRNGYFDVAIRDRGPGVPQDERERVFDRFARGARHRHGSVPGVGLGLYLARVIARRHGGELTCELPADGGAGTVFRFRFPEEITS